MAGGVAQGEGPEFKPQYHPKKKTERERERKVPQSVLRARMQLMTWGGKGDAGYPWTPVWGKPRLPLLGQSGE
jgi:hypothetical protein